MIHLHFSNSHRKKVNKKDSLQQLQAEQADKKEDRRGKQN